MKLYIAILVFIFFSCNENTEYNRYFLEHCSYDNVIVTPGVLRTMPRRCIVGATLPKSIQDIVSNHTNKSKYYLLNFWFLSCEPCIKEIPELNYLDTINKDLSVISFCRDSTSDINNNEKASEIIYSIIANSSFECDSIMNIIWGYPTNLLIDKDYNILFNFGGFSDDSPDYNTLLNFLFDEGVINHK